MYPISNLLLNNQKKIMSPIPLGPKLQSKVTTFFNSLILSISQSPLLRSSPSPALAQSLHSLIIKLGLASDIYIINNAIAVYSSFPDMPSARKLFDEHRAVADVVTWTAMLTGYSNAGDIDTARWFFDRCTARNLVTWNAMVAGYAQAGRPENARQLFDQMPERNAASWGSLVSGFVNCRLFREAIAVFREMVGVRVTPNEAALVSVVSACAQLRNLEQGEWVYGYVESNRARMSLTLWTAFVDMFGKCGDIQQAVKMFDEMPVKNVYSWNSLIKGLANNGCGRQALTLFWKMKQSGIEPNEVTFIGLLSACSHARLVDEGRRFFDVMTRVYDIHPSEEHYGCMVDLLARAGLIKEAMGFVDRMPVEPHAGLLGALAGGCTIHGEVEVGEEVAKRLIEMEPGRAGRYIMLANIYAAARRWDDVEVVRRRLKERRVGKVAGNSLVALQLKQI